MTVYPSYRTPAADPHIHLLGILRIAWGAVGLPAGLIVLWLTGGAGFLLGAGAGRDALPAAGILVVVGLVIGGICVAVGLPSILAGVGLLRGKEWGRILALVLAVLELFSFPLGTAIAVYSFWALLRPEAAAYFRGL